MKHAFLFFFLSIITLISRSQQTVGLFYDNPGALDGYVLFAPSSDSTYLIDKCGKRIHTWHSNYHPGLAVSLLPDGTLLRCGNTNNSYFQGGGQGGLLQELDWNSNVIWQYFISSQEECQHHDAIRLPNGNVMTLVWELHTQADAQDNGRTSVGTQMWSERIMEIHPVGSDSGIVVWEWKAWDHLIQDADASKPHYGVISEHPELIDINLNTLNNMMKDWLHFNGLDYDSVNDQVLVSSRYLSEVLIIDHSTTTNEAASHSGGNSGKGGDLLYRWGNPQNYDRGTSADRKFYDQHNPSFIPQGFPGAGDIMVFNNGVNRPGTDYLSAETFQPPACINYNYYIATDSAYKPLAQDWIFAPTPYLTANAEGGAQRLQNGNTLLCEPQQGTFIEVDMLGNYLWKYVNPVTGNGITTQGNNPINNTCFRATFIPSQYSGLVGPLIPGAPIEINPYAYNCVNYATSIMATVGDIKTLLCYPDPFQSSFSIHVPEEVANGTLQIHDVTGRLVAEEKNFYASPETDHLISLPDYEGMMIVTLRSESGDKVWNTRMVHQR